MASTPGSRGVNRSPARCVTSPALTVRATRKGFYSGALRRPGQVFELELEEHFSSTWMARVDAGTPIDGAQSDAWKPEWAHLPCTEHQLARICCGWHPLRGEISDPVLYNRALAKIRLGVQYGYIAVVGRIYTPEDPAPVGHALHDFDPYSPDERPALVERSDETPPTMLDLAGAWRWLKTQFPETFPFSADDFRDGPGSDIAVSTMPVQAAPLPTPAEPQVGDTAPPSAVQAVPLGETTKGKAGKRRVTQKVIRWRQDFLCAHRENLGLDAAGFATKVDIDESKIRAIVREDHRGGKWKPRHRDKLLQELKLTLAVWENPQDE